jgi:hypothetical protein
MAQGRVAELAANLESRAMMVLSGQALQGVFRKVSVKRNVFLTSGREGPRFFVGNEVCLPLRGKTARAVSGLITSVQAEKSTRVIYGTAHQRVTV